MPTLKALINAARSGEDLIVTGPHYRWLKMLESQQIYTPEAIAHALKVYLRLYKHPRAGRIGASSLGGCPRAAVFSYAGAPQVAPDPSSQEIFDHGSVGHLKWQMEGLTMGYMKRAEAWVEDKDLRVGGSIDAILSNNDVFELKTCAPSVYRRVVAENMWPRADHVPQVDGYMLLRDVPYASLVYEDRSYGAFHEFRLERDATREAALLRRLRILNRYIDEDDLPPMLPDCEMKTGNTYRQCFFRLVCPKMATVTMAQEAGKPEEDSGLQVELGTEIPEWIAKITTILAEVDHG
ncbi:MAG TPA: hypothetical protein VIT65_23260 [Microlunatus sp.]